MNCFGTIYVQGRELCIDNLIKCMFMIGLHSDAYEPVSFKLGIITDTSKLHGDTSMNDLDLQSGSQR